MSALISEYFTDLEKRTNHYLELIRRIDNILREPVITLIRITAQYSEDLKRYKEAKAKSVKGEAVNVKEPYFPVWVSNRVQPEPKDDLFTKSLCLTTVRRMQTLQRRFSWLEGKAQDLLFSHEIKDTFTTAFIPEGNRLEDYAAVLNGRTFGALDPLTASQVFSLFLNLGESEAHSDLGNLVFFAMVWPLHRAFSDEQAYGAAIEPWQPKAYVTAKCVLPIKELQSYCAERADLLDAIKENLAALKRLSAGAGPSARWLFNAELDDLWANLLRLKRIVIRQKALEDCADTIRGISDEMSQYCDDKEFARFYLRVCEATGAAFTKLGKEGMAVISRAQELAEMINKDLVKRLTNRQADKDYLRDNLKIKLASEYTEAPDDVAEDYFSGLQKAAVISYEFIRNTLNGLCRASEACANINDAKDTEIIEGAIAELAEANRKVAAEMNVHVNKAAVWCRTVVDREIAHASAQNFTDFDPSELVSAIAVATRWNQMTTTVQVSDAVSKAVTTGARADGSWSPGQPFYSPNHALGIWPVTSDIVWTLTGILKEHPTVSDADEALFRYVDWLELTRTVVIPAPKQQEGKQPPAGESETQSILNRLEGQPMVGWMSDRLRYRGKIHFATTAFSVNALLEIRDLIEYRLWQLCEKRFTVVQSRKGLKGVDPTDLGAIHATRLHKHLVKMARDAQDAKDYSNAEYSLVLHGPPGSSKTFIAKAFSVEMWKAIKPWGSKGPRFLQITPADFTRLGEDRLDSEARLIFNLLSGVRGVTIFFDEIDDLLRQRNTNGDKLHSPSFMALVVPAMLNRLADLRESCPRQETSFLLATNYVDSIEPALIRKGRIDRAVAVVYPDQESRRVLVSKFLDDVRKEKRLSQGMFDALCDYIVGATPRWPYMTIESVCKDVKRVAEENFPANAGHDNWRKINLLVSPLIKEHGASFTAPNYSSRRVDSQELLNEYMSYLICGFTGTTSDKVKNEFEKVKTLIKIGEGKVTKQEKFYKNLLAVMTKQKRIRRKRKEVSQTLVMENDQT